MDTTLSAVSLALRDTEICTAAAEVWEEYKSSVLGMREDQRRVLAVVTHKYTTEPAHSGETDGRVQREEGCLFVMKYKLPTVSELYPYLLFPIVPELTASLEQASNSASGFNVSEFKVTLRIPRGSVALGSNQIKTLSAVIEEARRLKNLADPGSSLISSPIGFPPQQETMYDLGILEQLAPDGSDDADEKHWVWLHFYLSHKASRILPSQQPKPRDIRTVLKEPALSASSAGLPGDEDADISLIRDEWVHRQLIARKSEYSQSRSVKLRIGTFNINGKSPSQSLSPWIHASRVDAATTLHSERERTLLGSHKSDSVLMSPGHDKHTSTAIATDVLIPGSASAATSTVTGMSSAEGAPLPSTPASSVLSGSSGGNLPATEGTLPDIFVLGFQELDLSTEALLYSTSTLKEDVWVAAIFDALGKDADDYVKLASKQLVGVLVVVIVRRAMEPSVKEVSAGSAGVGIMGIMGNKGAAAIRLRMDSMALTFVCSHLAAFDDYVDRRNSDFSELARKLEFPIMWRGARSTRAMVANIWETDILFWFGDLNYRIDLPDQEVRTLLSSVPQGLENGTLLAYDQLKTATRHKRAFVDFLEHDISFLPTYRFAEAPVDQLGYDLKRRPAWTDRILHLSADPSLVLQTSYLSHPEVTLSDHQPVSADFDIQLEKHDPHNHQHVAKKIFRALGDFEDSNEMPSVKVLDGTDVDLGQVSYLQPVARSLRLKNEGKVACAFRFIPLAPGSSITKEWLQVYPLSGILLPQTTETISLSVNIDKRTASFLNHGNTRLQDDLILHLTKGTDHVISVFGSYQPTCFANSLAWLVRSPGPIREQNSAQLLPEANVLSAPRELMFLVEWLITNAQDVDDLFISPADDAYVSAIRNHLDTQRLDSGREVSFPADADHRAIALAFGAALLQFLDSLTEPVIPSVLHSRCALAENREDAFEILDDVPSFARNVYVTVTAFLHFIAQSGGPQRSVALARIFASVLLRDNPRAPPGTPPLTPLGKRNFLLYTIA